MQKGWLEARDWDELLPSHHQREWTEWFRELEDLELVKIPRCLKDPSPKVEEQSIHTFSDASEDAYTAIVPVDLGTRGLTVKELAHSELWWKGPEFLKRSKQDWPECKFDKPTSTL